jgi:hypothetical protein
MKKTLSKKAVEAPAEEEKAPKKAKVVAAPAPEVARGVPIEDVAVDDAPVEDVINSSDFAYEVKAGRGAAYTGLSNYDVCDLVSALLGKVDKIVIVKK